MLFAIEGIDGVGKSTVVSILREGFEGMPNVFFTKEPRYIDADRKRWLLSIKDPLQRLFVFMLDHQEHMQDTVQPPLLSVPHAIITDRYIHSRIAYQTVEIAEYHKAEPMEVMGWIESLHKFSVWPDKVYIIWSDIDELTRRLKRGHDGMNEKDLNKLMKVEEVYLQILKRNRVPYVGFQMTEGSRDIAAEIGDSILFSLQS
jgi:dTMP kinase